MKFSMCDDEIRVSYNTAKDQKAQIKILAELNVTTPAAMAAKLRELGCDVRVMLGEDTTTSTLDLEVG